MTDQPRQDRQFGIEPKPESFEASGTSATDRRKALKLMGAAGAGALAPGFGATYLRGFEYTRSVQAQGSSPVKVGFIEDEFRKPVGLRNPKASRRAACGQRD